jgi:hypothetical protein
MPAFTAVGAYVAGTLLGLVGTSAIIVGAIVATGAAYITSRVINGNPNKGNNSSAGSQGGRIQVPPATNNKIPVLYGSAYVNGIITDARLKSLGGTTNDTMYYCIVLSEYTNNLTASPVYNLESVIWNDLRLTPVDATTNAHKVKDGRKVVNGAIVTSGSFVVGKTYIITKLGTTTQANWNTIAGTAGKVYDLGAIFTCANAGSATTGQAQEEDFIDTNFIVDSNSLVELRVYAGSSSAASQIYPPQATSNTQNAYDFWPDTGTPNGWSSANEMDGLVFAIVKLTYNGDKGFTGLPNVTFQLANNVANPADVWYDYMTSKRYGAGIDPAYIDTTAKLAWYNYCDEDITYTNKAGETNQVDLRYQLNGIIDTSRQVKTNIDTILQNGGAWMSYNVATGLWSPVIKKANSAGIAGDAATYFTASRSGTTLTVTAFPSGRIEAGQLLYNSTGTLIGTISAQLTPTAGETAGQKGRYTTSTTGSISSTTFYTLPASSLQFSDDNIISGITLSSTRLEDLYNEVEAEFYNKYNKDQKSYARTDLPSIQRNPNEPDNQLRFSLDLVNSSIQADILGQLEMRQSRDDLVIEFTSMHYGIQTQAGDIIAITSDLYGWAPKYFRVMRVKEIEGDNGDLTAQIQALEYNPDVYTIEPITEFSTAANIGIGNLVSSVGLPKPDTPTITNVNATQSIPNFTFNIDIPATGGPFDEVEIYFTEGWDPNSVTGTIVPGTGSNGVPVGKGLMTVTAATYNSINVGDYFGGFGNVTVESQLTQTTISTKTYVSGGSVGVTGFTLNNATGIIPGQQPVGTGIPSGAIVISVNGNTVNLDKAFTVQAAGSYTFTTAGGTGTYQVDQSLTASGTADLWDQPVESDFKYLKKIVPPGNASAFESGTSISAIITELAANSQVFRRYFLKARLGVKKNFGGFSANTRVDLDGNLSWNPNPIGGGGGSTNNITANQITIETTTTTGTANVLQLIHTTTGIASTNFGVALGFNIEQPDGSLEGNFIDCLMTDATPGLENFTFRMGLIQDGVEPGTPPGTVLPQLELSSQGQLKLTSANTNTILVDPEISRITLTNAASTTNTIYTQTTGTDSSLEWNGTNSLWTFGNQFGLANNTTTTPKGVQGTVAGNDYWFVGGNSPSGADNDGAMIIASGNNGIEPIYVRQYTGGITTQPFPSTNTVARELTLLDASGNTVLPGDLTVSGNDIKMSGGTTALTFSGTGDVTVAGSLKLNGSTSGSVTLSAGATPAVQTYTLPTAYPASNGLTLVSTTSGTLSWAATIGDVVGPSSATDNAVARFDLTTGKIIQNSTVTIADNGDIATNGDLSVNGGDITTTAATLKIAYGVGSGPDIELGRIGNTTTVNGELLIPMFNSQALSMGAKLDNSTPAARMFAGQSNLAGTSTQVLDQILMSQYRSAKYILSMSKSTEHQVTEFMVLHDGTNAYISISSNFNAGTSLATFTADINSGYLRPLITPTSSGTLDYNIYKIWFAVSP